MNNSRIPETPLSATYMTQDEASEVMQLWSERQRLEAARMSLVTIHDVAEAIQVAPEDVHQLLQEIRTSRLKGTQAPQPERKNAVVVSGGNGTWAVGGVLLFALAWSLAAQTRNGLAQTLSTVLFAILFVVSMSLLILYAKNRVLRGIKKQAMKMTVTSSAGLRTADVGRGRQEQ